MFLAENRPILGMAERLRNRIVAENPRHMLLRIVAHPTFNFFRSSLCAIPRFAWDLL
jgi:hypothetical protein